MARSVSFFTDSRAFGGAEEALFMLAESLDRSEWRISLLAPPSPVADQLADRCADLHIPFTLIEPMPLGFEGARRLPKLVRTLRKEGPDVFHAHLSDPTAAKYPLAAAVMARIPAVIATVQLVPPFPTDRSNRWQLRLLARGVDGYVAVSKDIRRKLVQDLGWPQTKIEVVYNAVRPEFFQAVDASGLRKSLTGTVDRPVVLTTARLDDQKGHSLLLEAATKVPDAVFVLAGDGPSRNALEARAATLGLSRRVIFLGHRSDVRELLAACDVFVLPSLYEGSSLAILEAMAAGRAIVATRIPGTDELIGHGVNGLLVSPDSHSLANEIRRLLVDPNLRSQLGEEGQTRAGADFTRDAMASRIATTYRRLLAAPGLEGSAAPTEALNPRLRRFDWRFLIDQRTEPKIFTMGGKKLRQDLECICPRDSHRTEEAVDLVVLDRPTGPRLRRAYNRLAPGGTVYARWRIPWLGNTERVRRALVTAGFQDIRVFWAGPRPFGGCPEFWVSLTDSDAAHFLLATRQKRGLASTLLRLAWRTAFRTGSLAPLDVLARREVSPIGERREISPGQMPSLLLTPGRRSINKVVGVVFNGESPVEVLKFARVPEAEEGLEREARVLQTIAHQRPEVEGIPRMLGTGRRMGRLAVRESALVGEPTIGLLCESRFPDLAGDVTSWLLHLAGNACAPVERSAWWERLVEDPLREFVEQFMPVLSDDVSRGVRGSLERLKDLPLVPEHRDCSPWNMVWLGPGRPALHDWESAEPCGLPLLDLVYFLANSAFILDDALSTGRTRVSYRKLLDPRTPTGQVAAACLARYCASLGIDAGVIPSLRVLTWVIHARSDFRHLNLDGMSAEGLKASTCLGLLKEELEASPEDP